MAVTWGDISLQSLLRKVSLWEKRPSYPFILFLRSTWNLFCSSPWACHFSQSSSPGADRGQAPKRETLGTKDKHPDINIITPETKHHAVCFSALSSLLLPLLSYSCLKEQLLYILYSAIKSQPLALCSSSTAHFRLVLAPGVIGTFDQLVIAPAWPMCSLQRSALLGPACINRDEAGPMRRKHLIMTVAWLPTSVSFSLLCLWTWGNVHAFASKGSFYSKWTLSNLFSFSCANILIVRQQFPVSGWLHSSKYTDEQLSAFTCTLANLR